MLIYIEIAQYDMPFTKHYTSMKQGTLLQI